MTEALLVLVVAGLVAVVALLADVRSLLGQIARNQRAMAVHAHEDVAKTASVLLGADSSRQSHDPASGEDAVITKSREES